MAGENGAMIKLDGVDKIFYTDELETHALSDIHLEIKQGEYLAIAGPSGCGKSTLLSLIGLLDAPTNGEYSIKGESVARLTVSDRCRIRNREIGFIFQAFNLFPTLTAGENVELVLELKGIRGKAARRNAAELLEQVGLLDKYKSFPPDLSGGQMQRVAIARALVNSPKVLLADEPTGNLDTSTGNTILELLLRLTREQNTATLIATHSAEAAAIADVIVTLRDGKVADVKRK